MIRDRGNIKWTSLMLPEHVNMLRKFANEEYYEESEPIIDEQQLEEVNNLIAESMEFTYPLHFQYYRNKRMNSLEGFVHYVDDINRQLRVLDANGEIHKLSFSSIKRATRVE
ncbi:YolD-like family protein [Peribacillus deserti]|uniref:YolD-like family protein n=1 Tax=Peribacillus deserti TaxID=673318 RepID=A0A2N5M1J2_9BACI|nr:YolD-like family protein [Peribacillus deserti]PLT28175.1 YolD-like family protein [Peribacillus deserti]